MCEVMLTPSYDLELLKGWWEGWNNFTTWNKPGLWHLEKQKKKKKKKKIKKAMTKIG